MNMDEYIEATERYMRLALKAQGQCWATLETLAAIKNPPVVFARQANFANGPQQVNNDPLRAEIPEPPPTKLLAGNIDGGTQMGTGATTAATRGDPAMATLDTNNRAKKPRG